MAEDGQYRNIWREVSWPLGRGGQRTEIEIENIEKRGCFDHCDGWPQQLSVEDMAIYDEWRHADPSRYEELLERARKHQLLRAHVHDICQRECEPGGFGLFASNDRPSHGDGRLIRRPCPIKERLAEAVLAFGDVLQQ